MRKAFGPTSTLHFTRSLHVTPGHNFLLDLRRTVLLVLNSGVLFMFPHHFLTVFDRSHVLRYQAFIGEEFQESFSLTWDVHDCIKNVRALVARDRPGFALDEKS